MQTIHTVRGKKSPGELDLAQVTVERTLVSSMPSTTEPLANRAIFPVSRVTTWDPTSNSSLKDSSILVPAGEYELDGGKPRRPEQMVRKPKARHASRFGREDDLARRKINDISTYTVRDGENRGRA